MTQIWEHLFLGGLTDAESLAESNQHGIATVITLCEVGVHSKCLGVCYIHLPIADDEPVSKKRLRALTDAIGQSVRSENVLIHCGEGVSRAPLITAAFMQSVGYRNIDDSLAEIRRIRPCISPSDVLLASMKENMRCIEPFPVGSPRH